MTYHFTQPAFTHTARPARPVRFGSGGAILRARAGESLALEDLRNVTPAIFAHDAHEGRSEKFVAIPTVTVLEPMLKEGFQIVEARQGGTRDASRRGFTKHRLRLRHPSAPNEMKLGGLYPEIVLTNGNDGTSAYWLEAGLFRLVCLNGMMVQDRQFEAQRVAHRGRVDQVVQGVIDASYTVIDQLPATIDQAGAMHAIALNDREQMAFARAALQLRWDDPEAGAPIEPQQVLRARRAADASPDLWSTMNRVQEGLIRGGQRYEVEVEGQRRPQRRTVGEVRGLDQDRAINRALWTLANEMAALKAA